MNRSVIVAIGLYSLFLRLYPAPFRAEFADEMRAVFEAALRNAARAGAASAAGWLLLELHDLPGSVAREHLTQRRRVQWNRSQEELAMHRIDSPRLFRLCTMGILALCTIVLLAAVSAYFVFDLHHNSLQNVGAWWYTRYDTFIFRHEPLVDFMFILIPLASVPLTPLFGIALVLNVWRRWYKLTQWQQQVGMAGILFAVLLTFLWVRTPLAEVVGLWFWD